MAARDTIVAELKRALRENGQTYADVARHLKLSLPSIKRLFSTGDFSLERVDQICELVGVELNALLERSQKRAPTRQLTLEQEREIVADAALFLVTWLVLSRTPIEEILDEYRFSAAELQRLLIRLDRLKVIELQPGNRARVLVNRRFTWRPGGPVQRYIHQKLLREFLASDFADAQDEFFFNGDALSDQGLLQIKRVLQNAARECMEVMERDLPAKPKRHGAAFVLAVRRWDYSGFAELRRNQDRR